MDSEPVMLYDGSCGMCNRAVTFALRHERAPVLKFASLDSDYARKALAERGWPEAPPDTAVIVDGPVLHIRSDATLFVAGLMRAPWRWTRVFRIVPRPWRDAAYDFVARRRHRWFPPDHEACAVPDKTTRGRFLQDAPSRSGRI